jgi:hypothetical protein
MEPCYYECSMQQNQNNRGPFTSLWRAILEIAFIIFLFYSNLLMGEFTTSNGHGKNLLTAFFDIFTATNFAIALISAMIGYLVFEYLRKKL